MMTRSTHRILIVALPTLLCIAACDEASIDDPELDDELRSELEADAELELALDERMDERMDERETDETVVLGSPTPASAQNRYIVKFSDEVEDPEVLADRLVAEFGGVRRHVYTTVMKGFLVVDLPEDAVEQIRRNPLVERIEHDNQVRRAATQTDAGWGLGRIDQGSGIDFDYNFFFTGSGVHVYILDTGVNGDHDEFSGRMGISANSFDSTSAWVDIDGHGTACASLAAGETLGPARDATIHSVKITDEEWAWSADIVQGLDWVAASGPKPAVANLSYEGDWWVASAMDGAINNGVVMVKAAGNDNEDACDDSGNEVSRAIIVGASDYWNARAYFSNWGSCVSLFAPGDGVLFAWNTGTSGTGTGDGTSFAAPYVAGVAALMLQQQPMNSLITKTKLITSGWSGVLKDNVYNPLNGSPNLMVNSLHHSASITGPGQINSGMAGIDSNFTVQWTRQTLGGNGSWTFKWERSINGGAFTQVGTGSSYTMTVVAGSNYTMNLRLTATSAGRSVVTSRYITVEAEEFCTNWKLCD